MIDTALTTYDECHPNCKHIVRECKAMSIKDVAKHYGIAEITVRKKYLNGTFPMFKILNLEISANLNNFWGRPWP